MIFAKNEKLTSQQESLRLIVILCFGIPVQYCLDKFGIIIMSKKEILLLTFFVISFMTIISSRFISHKKAILVSIILSTFESACGQLILIESTNSADPWPPAYFLSIPFYAVGFYIYALMINMIIKQKYNRT